MSAADRMMTIDRRDDYIAAFRGMPKAAGKLLREASKEVADRDIKPEYQRAAFRGAKGKLAKGQAYTATGRDAIYPRSDRFPVVLIGRKTRSYSGGASSIMTRFASDAARWLPLARPRYEAPALRRWQGALYRLDRLWVHNTGQSIIVYGGGF